MEILSHQSLSIKNKWLATTRQTGNTKWTTAWSWHCIHFTVSPAVAKSGYGRRFVEFYENYALANNCHYLRLDTNERNERARQMYAKLGYDEIGIVPTAFNGIEGVNLVCLEKTI